MANNFTDASERGPRRVSSAFGGWGHRPGRAPPGDASKTRFSTGRGAKQREDSEGLRLSDEIDQKLGFARLSEGESREGWLLNMHPTILEDDQSSSGCSAVEYYFIQDDGGMFKASITHEPYFLISPKDGTEDIVEEYLIQNYVGVLSRVARVWKADLKKSNHLTSPRRLYLQLRFRNLSDFLAVRNDLLSQVLRNIQEKDDHEIEVELAKATAKLQVSIDNSWSTSPFKGPAADPRESITDIREYDIPYCLQVAIDNDVRVGLWYKVNTSQGKVELSRIGEKVKRAEPVVMAYDIEVTKLPLKFPDQSVDQIMMISYMIDGQGYLITNREIVSEDIENFEYTPKPEYEGPFTVFNAPNEEAAIRRWFEHIRESKPTIMATYNGDSFDFPFVDARARINGLDMYKEIGFKRDFEEEYKRRACIHMDCFRWVQRDSYLPQGSQGLKAVTTYKLGYNPAELDPELMTPYARDRPQILAQYSVSDAVATYYLYMKYVHPFVFSLCNIIPLNLDEVLRKGSGTLCETLLMVEASRSMIVMPNRHEERQGSMYNGHLLVSETYVGGHVEALEAGVFRSDLGTKFKVVPSALMDDLDSALKFCIVHQLQTNLEYVTNYDEVKGQILTALEDLRDNFDRFDNPLIYHLDVAAMYPNIMLSNRLQPDSMVDEGTCAVCHFNRPGKTCDRRMVWAWRGEYFPAQQDEYNMVKHALQQETFPGSSPSDRRRKFDDLPEAEKTALMHKRLGAFSQKVYKKTKETKIIAKEAIICQRENPFYIDTVRSFRDRRYEYKDLHKTWKKNLDLAKEGGSIAEIDEAKKMAILYDSLQLAHKCILNSFYGYVMRKGARWHSMEMAGITCYTGASIIQMARQLLEQIGRPLELDTDGIWCMLPRGFPENFNFTTKGKHLSFSYPCVMLNHLVHAKFTNHQYHDLIDPEAGTWAVRSENSIFFELDGPYKAIVIPSSQEEDKLLKKRYAVFNDDGSLAELKGFEIKRRGELQLIKIFQSQIFERFLLGTSTEECYAAVAVVANRWLDVLFNKASTIGDEELVELIAENRSMSKTLAEYGGQKSTSISTAKRLAEFLGDQMVKDKGLACRFVISALPVGAPVTERAIPVAIFSAEVGVKQKYLRKWLKDSSWSSFDLRSILDWDYYIDRLGSVIQKLITIPAAMQKVPNPVPRIRHPDWLQLRVSALGEKLQQQKLTEFFQPLVKTIQDPSQHDVEMEDLEDIGQISTSVAPRVAVVTKRYQKAISKDSDNLPPLPANPIQDFRGFIQAMQPRWRIHWQNIQQHQDQAATGRVVPLMFHGARVKHWDTSTWDIVQIRERDTLGEFTMWTYVDSALIPIKLRINREFYINMRTEAEETTFENTYSALPVIRTLPRNHPLLHLYKIVATERTYLGEESHFAELLNHPAVEGVYELQVSLVMRAILLLGTRGTIEDSSSMTYNKAKEYGFDLADLERAPASPDHRPYLDRGLNISFLLLFHSSTYPRHVFALFHPSGTANVYLVDPRGRRQPLTSIEETYVTLLRDREATNTAIPYPNNIQPHIAHHGSEAAALQAISQELGRVQAGSTALVISSLKTKAWFEEVVPRVDRFPLLWWQGSKKGHTSETSPWQKDVVNKMLKRYLGMGLWLYRVIHEAALYDVPVGNIEGDEPLYYTDIDFARRLLRKDMVIWWSSSGMPDLGGEEDGGNPLDELATVEINNPGCYANVCLYIQVQNLALNAVIQSAIVLEMEGDGRVNAFDSILCTFEKQEGPGRSLGETAVSPQVFTVLKEMVKAWVSRTDGFVHLGIDHFWRWLSSGASQMFDPSLQRFVYGLMQKNFLHMLAEFRRLGSTIIAADFSHVLLLTPNPPGTAAAYATYLLATINSHELLKCIDLDTARYYDFLLYMDSANLGGVSCEDPHALGPPAIIPIFMQWNIATFLPPALQPIFKNLVKQFIVKIYRTKQEHTNSPRTPAPVAHSLTQRGSDPGPVDAEKLKENAVLAQFISKQLTRKMLRDVTEITSMLQAASSADEYPDEWVFPLLPGSHLTMTKPLLEYIKFACAVFRLTRGFSTELGVLEKNLLTHIGVKQFSEEAVFRNPCEPFILRMVVCRICSTSRDFDFCRDPDLLPEDLNQGINVRWQCPVCQCDYDRKSIEASLIDVARRLLVQFQLQDLRCGRCKQIKSDSLSTRCNCSGAYQYTLPKSESKRRIRTLYNIAVFHGLPLVREYVGHLLENW